MGTTTVRLDAGDEQILDKLAPACGGRSNVIRRALRQLALDIDHQEHLAAALAEWELDAGPIDEDAVEAMARRLGR